MLPLVGRASQNQSVLFPDAAAGKVEACIRECPAAAVTAETPWAASPIPFDRLPTLQTESFRTGFEEQGKILLSFDVFHTVLLSAEIPEALETKDFRA